MMEIDDIKRYICKASESAWDKEMNRLKKFVTLRTSMGHGCVIGKNEYIHAGYALGCSIAAGDDSFESVEKVADALITAAIMRVRVEVLKRLDIMPARAEGDPINFRCLREPEIDEEKSIHFVVRCPIHEGVDIEKRYGEIRIKMSMRFSVGRA